MSGKSILKKIYLIVTGIVVISALAGATYAWFSMNTITTTDLVSAHTDDVDVKLLVSSYGGGAFKGGTEAAITGLNTSKEVKLMPVSTADLKTFVSNANNELNIADAFFVTKDDSQYYHGRIYLKAVATGMPATARLALYFDESAAGGGPLLQNKHGNMSNASRLGLTFNGAEPVILRLSEQSNAPEDRTYNTMVDGTLLKGDYVVVLDQEKPKALPDPSVYYATYCVREDGTMPAGSKPLILMDLNEEYAVDIYFYLEGCDPDCTNVLQLNDLDFHLGFYGVLLEETNG